MKIGVPLGRLDEMLNGVNFGTELAYHLEVVLRLPSGFMDKPGASLGQGDIEALKALPQDDLLDEDSHLPLHRPATPTVPLNPPVAAASGTASEPLPPTPSPAPIKETLMSEAVSSTPDAEELAKRDIRRANFAMLTQPKGVKSRLVALTGLSAANISHRLHGHKLFDAETGEFFCRTLGLPSGWFETPKTESDIPPEALSILSGTTQLPAVAPTRQPKTISKTALVRPAGAPLAPTRVQKAAAVAPTPTLSLSSAALGASVVNTPRVSGVAARKKAGPAPAPASPVAAPVAQSTAPATAGLLTAHPAVAPISQASPVLQAYLLVLNQKLREGRVSDEKALELLQSALEL